ncbi:MAG: isomerizing glutamine--fructose-6-phosphate transaminase [Terriglobales bacterium]
MREPTQIEGSSRQDRFSRAMLREIYEQPQAISETIDRHVAGERIFGDELESLDPLLNVSRIIIAASGSSRHAGLAAEIVIEDFSGVAVDVEYASEYSYRSTHSPTDPLVMVVSQSGETADTVAAQREARGREVKTLAICNVSGATIAREATVTLLTHAGAELAVPATKSFTSQLALLYLLALFLARKRGAQSLEAVRNHLCRLRELPSALSAALPMWDEEVRRAAEQFREAQAFLYLGRGVHYAIAREGALKLKEISYAHAEGLPTGELKHGPYALVTRTLPIVALATCDRSDPDSGLRYRKTLGVLGDIKARGGKLIVVATQGDEEVPQLADHVFFVPPAPELLLPMLEVVPLQLLAYHIAILNGCDVDHPRNLVKAVVRE